jgi:hypothetical protein
MVAEEGPAGLQRGEARGGVGGPPCATRPRMTVHAIEPLATISTYDELITALRQRAIALNSPLEAIDDVAGLPTRYTTKLLGKTKMLGPMSFGAMLGALALKLAVMPDNDALARIRHRLPPRDACGRGPPLLAWVAGRRGHGTPVSSPPR